MFVYMFVRCSCGAVIAHRILRAEFELIESGRADIGDIVPMYVGAAFARFVEFHEKSEGKLQFGFGELVDELQPVDPKSIN